MEKRKKIISIVLKSGIGIACAWIVYERLKNDFTPDKLDLLTDSMLSSHGLLSLVFCVLLIPVNWGIESWKWKVITEPVERISFKTAQMSVYSGICIGNLAPARATEFLAKIIFFKDEHKAKVSVLHFVNGMFQLCITYVAGFIALSYKIDSFGQKYQWIAYSTIAIAIIIMALFGLCLFKIKAVLHYAARKQHVQVEDFRYRFTPSMLLQLFGFSIIRYGVFFLQMLLLINLFNNGAFTWPVILAVALYFLITATIPMFSVVEAAMRAAIALVLFKNTGISDASMALASVSVWLINIILPSIVGYFILLQENFDFYLRGARK